MLWWWKRYHYEKWSFQLQSFLRYQHANKDIKYRTWQLRHLNIGWLFPCYCAETSCWNFARLSTSQPDYDSNSFLRIVFFFGKVLTHVSYLASSRLASTSQPQWSGLFWLEQVRSWGKAKTASSGWVKHLFCKAGTHIQMNVDMCSLL